MESKFEHIADDLRKQVSASPAGERLPSEASLARSYGTTTMTLRRALDILLAEGLIVKQPRIGIFTATHQRSRLKVAINYSNVLHGARPVIEADLREHFTDLDINWIMPSDRHELWSADLVIMPATNNIPYRDAVLPIPGEIIAEYSGGSYFERPFMIHQVDDLHYSLPLLFSPSTLLMDEELTTPEDAVDSMDLPRLLELGRRAKAHGIPLWSRGVAADMLELAIFSSGDSRGELSKIDSACALARVKQLAELFAPEYIALNEERALLNWTCRQDLKEDTPGRIALMPFGLNRIAGEFMMLPIRSGNRHNALEVAKYLLSEKIQGVIGKTKSGIPVLKSAAMDSFDSSTHRDDIFFNEIRNMLYNNTSEYDFINRLHWIFHELCNGRIAHDTLPALIAYEIDIATQQRRWSEMVFAGR